MASANPNRDFHHPYEPYKIQLQFMNAVYDCLENGKVGIFESPTGTGKSLSLICGSLTWLRDHKRQKFEQGFAVDTGDSGDPKWLVEHAQKQRRQEATRRLQVFNDRIAKIKAKERRAKDRYTADEPRFKKQKTGISEDQSDDDEAQFALVEYESDDESRRRAEIGTVDESGLSAETQALMQSLGLSIGGSKEEDLEAPDETKIFFCSRTHSQLTQFAGEINRVRLPPVITTDDQASYSDETALVEDVKYLTLGSRKNLCINPKVNRLGNATAINERCLEMQQSSASSSGKCKYMPTKDSEVLVHDFRDNVLAKVRDIEDLGALGKTLGVCPYYASRSVTKYSEVSESDLFPIVPLR
jgi:chromosome transmission fidelity protein 1